MQVCYHDLNKFWMLGGVLPKGIRWIFCSRVILGGLTLIEIGFGVSLVFASECKIQCDQMNPRLLDRRWPVSKVMIAGCGNAREVDTRVTRWKVRRNAFRIKGNCMEIYSMGFRGGNRKSGSTR